MKFTRDASAHFAGAISEKKSPNASMMAWNQLQQVPFTLIQYPASVSGESYSPSSTENGIIFERIRIRIRNRNRFARNGLLFQREHRESLNDHSKDVQVEHDSALQETTQ
jgi:hypothetical protein